jgi:hypothetical protein
MPPIALSLCFAALPQPRRFRQQQKLDASRSSQKTEQHFNKSCKQVAITRRPLSIKKREITKKLVITLNWRTGTKRTRCITLAKRPRLTLGTTVKRAKRTDNPVDFGGVLFRPAREGDERTEAMTIPEAMLVGALSLILISMVLKGQRRQVTKHSQSVQELKHK